MLFKRVRFTISTVDISSRPTIMEPGISFEARLLVLVYFGVVTSFTFSFPAQNKVRSCPSKKERFGLPFSRIISTVVYLGRVSPRVGRPVL